MKTIVCGLFVLAFAVSSASGGTVVFDLVSADSNTEVYEITIDATAFATFDAVDILLGTTDSALPFSLVYAPGFVASVDLTPPVPVVAGLYGAIGGTDLYFGGFRSAGWEAPLLIGTLTVDVSGLSTPVTLQIDSAFENANFAPSVSMVSYLGVKEDLFGSVTVGGGGPGVIGPAGGTVENTDGLASVTFPPGCLSSDTTISIDSGTWPGRMFIDGPVGVLASYNFEPGMLEFCPGAELCMKADLTAEGLGLADCSSLIIKHQDEICTVAGPGHSVGDQCSVNADCGAGGLCQARFHSHVEIPACVCTVVSGRIIADCCTHPEHFSEFGVVIPDTAGIPTVSEWGLVALTLLLLAGAKVYFGRGRARPA